ncbi:MAG: GNAT family N-acetyltransferase [Novosphingobium sp.]
MIAPATEIDWLMAVMEAAFPPEYGEAWSRRQVCDALIVGNCHYGFIAADGTENPSETNPAAGFFMGRRIVDEEELLLFAIAPAYRRQGLGHALLARFIADAQGHGMKRIFLEMRRGNPAGFLYAAHGFREIGIRPAYYRTPGGQRIDAVSHELTFED